MNRLPQELWDGGLRYAAFRTAATRNGELFDRAYEEILDLLRAFFHR